MNLKTKLRYKGYTSTPSLWNADTVSQFKFIELSSNVEDLDDSVVFKNKRLGKLVEEFVFYQLKQQKSINWICDTLQIQNGKQTIGEIDALYYQKEGPIHLEIVYKFYLYDTLEDYNLPLAHWIGPNRKDSLLYKLNKLSTKQFPLLYNNLTKTALEAFNLNTENIEQQLCFKAQLFLPYENRAIDVSPLNPNCIAGFYISYNQLELLQTHDFFIPDKLDWLVMPYTNITWVNYSTARALIKDQIHNQRSPLVWIKDNNAELTKCFITFW